MNKRKFKHTVRNHPRVIQAIQAYRDEAAKPTDVLGWYTGKPSEAGDMEPQQDHDDL